MLLKIAVIGVSPVHLRDGHRQPYGYHYIIPTALTVAESKPPPLTLKVKLPVTAMVLPVMLI